MGVAKVKGGGAHQKRVASVVLEDESHPVRPVTVPPMV